MTQLTHSSRRLVGFLEDKQFLDFLVGFCRVQTGESLPNTEIIPLTPSHNGSACHWLGMFELSWLWPGNKHLPLLCGTNENNFASPNSWKPAQAAYTNGGR